MDNIADYALIALVGSWLDPGPDMSEPLAQ